MAGITRNAGRNIPKLGMASFDYQRRLRETNAAIGGVCTVKKEALAGLLPTASGKIETTLAGKLAGITRNAGRNIPKLGMASFDYQRRLRGINAAIVEACTGLTGGYTSKKGSFRSLPGG